MMDSRPEPWVIPASQFGVGPDSVRKTPIAGRGPIIRPAAGASEPPAIAPSTGRVFGLIPPTESLAVPTPRVLRTPARVSVHSDLTYPLAAVSFRE